MSLTISYRIKGGNVKQLAGSFSRIGASKVLVIGDFMLDTYTIGRVRRISPEAPVPVIHVQHEEHRPGGAGNVVLNLVSLGAEVVAVGRIGNDHAGNLLKESLAGEGVNVAGMCVQHGLGTPVKNRVIADNQQVVRVDHEQIIPISEQLEQQLIDQLPALLEGIGIVAISDYGKGSLSPSLLASLIELAQERSIPVIADPKGSQFAKYRGVTILKPNLSEAIIASGLPHDAPLALMAEKILHLSQAEMLVITRSEEGMSIFYNDGQEAHFPVSRVHEVIDVTGAGDTVLAMLASAIANGLPIEEAAQLSNLAAGIAVERLGCARVTLGDLARGLLRYDHHNKVFDEEHLFALKEALRGQRFVLLGLDSRIGMTPPVFKTIRSLATREKWDLIVYIRDDNASQDFIEMLSSLHEVSFIILKGANWDRLCAEIQPTEVHIIDLGALDGDTFSMEMSATGGKPATQPVK
jgi:rfaE bifunctional protein kinase chain/domain